MGSFPFNYLTSQGYSSDWHSFLLCIKFVVSRSLERWSLYPATNTPNRQDHIRDHIIWSVLTNFRFICPDSPYQQGCGTGSSCALSLLFWGVNQTRPLFSWRKHSKPSGLCQWASNSEWNVQILLLIAPRMTLPSDGGAGSPPLVHCLWFYWGGKVAPFCLKETPQTLRLVPVSIHN